MGGFLIWTRPSDLSDFVVRSLFGTFPIFWGFSHFVWGFSRFVLFLFLGLLTAPTGKSPESSPRKQSRLILPKKWKPPVLETFRELASPKLGTHLLEPFRYSASLLSMQGSFPRKIFKRSRILGMRRSNFH